MRKEYKVLLHPAMLMIHWGMGGWTGVNGAGIEVDQLSRAVERLPFHYVTLTSLDRR